MLQSAVLLDWKKALPQSLEHHSLSFCDMHELGSLLQASKGQREVVIRYLQQAQSVTIESWPAPSPAAAFAMSTAAKHCVSADDQRRAYLERR